MLDNKRFVNFKGFINRLISDYNNEGFRNTTYISICFDPAKCTLNFYIKCDVIHLRKLSLYINKPLLCCEHFSDIKIVYKTHKYAKVLNSIMFLFTKECTSERCAINMQKA